MYKNEIYLQHYMEQSCGWVKVAEYACVDQQQVERIKREIMERHPSDVVKFIQRGGNHVQDCM